MSDKATERAREIVAEWNKPPITAAAPKLEDVIADALRQTERAVWLSAAEVAEVMAEGYRAQSCPHCRDGEIGCSNTARHLRRRAEEV